MGIAPAFLPLLLCACAASAQADRTETIQAASAQRSDVATAASAAEANRAFGVELYKRLAAKPGNVVLSPISLAGAFGPVAAGAEAQTRAAIGEAMNFPAEDARLHGELGAMLRALESDGDGASVSIANGLWLMRGFEVKPAFLRTAEEAYDAEVETVDFANSAAAAARINGWVKAETKGRIPTLFSPDAFDSMTRVVVTNAVHFLGDWSEPFQLAATQQQPFYLDGGATKPVPLMHGERRLRYAEDDQVQIIDLPYKGGRLSMTVILPKRKNGLGAVEAQLTDQRLGRWLSTVDQAPAQEVRVFLPRVKTENSYALNAPLIDMGMGIAFDRNRANFRGIADEQLFISQVLQKTFLRMDEKGTEAAAATGVVIQVTGARMNPPPTFRADHPFLMLIRDHQTGAVLFLGRIADPAAG